VVGSGPGMVVQKNFRIAFAFALFVIGQSIASHFFGIAFTSHFFTFSHFSHFSGRYFMVNAQKSCKKCEKNAQIMQKSAKMQRNAKKCEMRM
jgi:hypothetical protein